MSEFNRHLDFLRGNNLIRSAQNALSKPGLRFTNEPDSVFKGRHFLRHKSTSSDDNPQHATVHSVFFNSFLKFSIQRSCLTYFVEQVFLPFLVSFVV